MRKIALLSSFLVLVSCGGGGGGGSPAPVANPGATATYVGPAPFVPPSFDPPSGAAVGVAAPIMIKFQRPILNKPLALRTDADRGIL